MAMSTGAHGGSRPVWDCAVSLKFLLQFAEDIPEQYSTSEVVEAIIKPATRDARCRYVDLIPPADVGTSSFFISHRWGCNFRAELVAVLRQRFGGAATVAGGGGGGGGEGGDSGSRVVCDGEGHSNDRGAVAATRAAGGDANRGGGGGGGARMESAEGDGVGATAAAFGGGSSSSGGGDSGGGAAAPVFIWLDIFAVNQHPNTTQADDLANLQNVIRHSVATVMLLDCAGAVFTRIWCLYEAWKTAEFKGAGGLQMLAPSVNYAALERVFTQLDVRAAEATVEEDRVRILAEVDSSMGAQQLNIYIKAALVDSAVHEAEAEARPAAALARPLLLQRQAAEAEAEAKAEAAAVAAAGAAGAEISVNATGPAATMAVAAAATRAAAATTAAIPLGAPSAVTGPAVEPAVEPAAAGEEGPATAAAAGAATVPPSVPAAVAMSEAARVQLARAGAACFKASRMLQFIARLRDAEAFMREAVSLFQLVEGGMGRHTLAALQCLGGVLLPQRDRAADAAGVLRRALEGALQVYGRRHEFTGAVVNELGLLESVARNWQGAEELWRWALAVFEERAAAMGEAEGGEAVRSVSLSLGVALAKQGKVEEGEAALRLALRRFQAHAGGKADAGVGECLGQLGRLALEAGRAAEAEGLLKEAVALRQQIFSVRHPSVVDGIADLARAMAAQGSGRLPHAAALCRSALQLSRELLGAEHPLAVRIAVYLAEMEEQQQRQEGEQEGVRGRKREGQGEEEREREGEQQQGEEEEQEGQGEHQQEKGQDMKQEALGRELAEAQAGLAEGRQGQLSLDAVAAPRGRRRERVGEAEPRPEEPEEAAAAAAAGGGGDAPDADAARAGLSSSDGATREAGPAAPRDVKVGTDACGTAGRGGGRGGGGGGGGGAEEVNEVGSNGGAAMVRLPGEGAKAAAGSGGGGGGSSRRWAEVRADGRQAALGVDGVEEKREGCAEEAAAAAQEGKAVGGGGDGGGGGGGLGSPAGCAPCLPPIARWRRSSGGGGGSSGSRTNRVAPLKDVGIRL